MFKPFLKTYITTVIRHSEAERVAWWQGLSGIRTSVLWVQTVPAGPPVDQGT